MDIQARNTGQAKTFSAHVGTRTYVGVEATVNEYGVLLQDCGVTGRLELCEKVNTCHVNCLTYQTLILAAQCGKLLTQVAMNISFILFNKLFHKDI